MSEIPRPRRDRPGIANPHGLEANPGLRPLHMEPPAKDTGLRPLGQVDGLEALQPTTEIFPGPQHETGAKKTEAAKRRLATGLDWSDTEGDA